MLEDTQVELLKIPPSESDLYDVIIIGAGPAGMSAGVCAARAKLKTLIIEKALPGGECSTACEINNFVSHPGGILGDELGQKMEEQLFSYQVHYSCENVIDISDSHSREKKITTDLGKTYQTRSIILAMGLEPKKLDAGFESKFLGRGISYYARCDVDYYTGKDVIVIGGGNCACYAAEYLSRFVNKVTMVHHYDHLRAVNILKEKINNNPKVDIIWNSHVTEVFGIDKVEKAKVVNVTNDQYTWIDVKGIFVYGDEFRPKIF